MTRKSVSLERRPDASRAKPTFRPQDLLDANPARLAIIDTDAWRVRYQNRSSVAQLGDLSGKTCHEAIAGNPTVCAFCKAREALRTGRATASEVRLSDGRWMLVEWAPVRSTDRRLFAVETITDITETKRREEEARALRERFERLAARDPLTGLLNRRGWLERALRIIRRAAHHRAAVGVLVGDLDRFKRINDTWGHAAGDAVIVETGRRLSSILRPGDLIGRWGGEEFIVLIGPPVGALSAIAQRLVDAVGGTPMAGVPEAGQLVATISIGGACAPVEAGDSRDLERIIALADRRLLAAKRHGRNQAVCQPLQNP